MAGEDLKAPPRGLVALLATGAGLAVANLYYSQALLARIGDEFHAPPDRMGLLSTVTQIGYAAGMLFLVPLGDAAERRRLILRLCVAAIVTLALVALAPTFETLLVASCALGCASAMPQVIVPYAAGLGGPRDRGRYVGGVMSGVLVGILLSRTASGFVGGNFGWRAIYAVAIVAMAALWTAMRAKLPEQHPEREVPYRELLGSLAGIFRREPILRRHALLGALTFGAFSVFWTTLAFRLREAPFHVGPEIVGLFGIVGVAGAAAAPFVGRLADRHDPRVVNGGAIATVLAGFVALWLGRDSYAGIAGAVVLLDLGVQSNHIGNQTRIFALDPALRNRLNTIYMVAYFAGGAVGSSCGALAWAHAGWAGVCALGATLGALALLAFATVGTRARSAPIEV